MTQRTERPSGARAVGVVLWWIVATVVAPIAAVVTAVALLSLSSGPASVGVAVLAPVVVIGTLLLGARRLARTGGPAAGTRMLRAHLALVLVLTAAFLAALVAASVADLGSVGDSLLTAIGGVPLLGLGAPWTLLRGFLPLDTSGPDSRIVLALVWITPALLNVGVHAAVLRLVRRFRDPAAGVSPA